MSISFSPQKWLTNPHIQTILPYIFRRKSKHCYTRERHELSDGDFIDLDWYKSSTISHQKDLVILLHGLQGDSQSHYMLGFAQSLYKQGFAVVALNSRGLSGEINRLPVTAHAGHTKDIDYLVRKLKSQAINRSIHIVAVSLGGCMLLNWMARTKDCQTLIDRAIAISTPYNLFSCAKKLESGFSKLYQSYLIHQSYGYIEKKASHVRLPITLPHRNKVKTFLQFDDLITAPINNFKGVNDYYQQASVLNKLKDIKSPLLLIHALDDPFMYQDSIPNNTHINEHIKLELSEHGGHVGFVRLNKMKLDYWLEMRILKFLIPS